jgi:hypothetical protein
MTSLEIIKALKDVDKKVTAPNSSYIEYLIEKEPKTIEDVKRIHEESYKDGWEP